MTGSLALRGPCTAGGTAECGVVCAEHGGLCRSEQVVVSGGDVGQEQVLPSHVERAGLFGFNLLHPSTHTVVLTSDERSALAVYQAAKVPGLALPKGTLTSEVFHWLTRVTRGHMLLPFF